MLPQDILNQIHVTNPNYDATAATSNDKSVVVNKANIESKSKSCMDRE
jgi:hypothetical protein